MRWAFLDAVNWPPQDTFPVYAIKYRCRVFFNMFHGYRIIPTMARLTHVALITYILCCLFVGTSSAQTETRNPGIDQAATSVTPTDAGENENASRSAPSNEYIIQGGDLGYLAMGIVFIAIGVVTLLLTILRSASRDATIFLFVAMSCVWGARFLFYTQLAHQILPGDTATLLRLARGFTFFSASTAFGFAFAYLGPGWRSSLRGLTYISFTFSIVASLMLMLNPDRDLLLPVFNVMIIIGAMLIIANTLHPDLRQNTRRQGLIAGFCFSIIFFILENLRTLGLVTIPFDVEWIGVLILYLTLGRLMAVHMFTNESRLASISQELATARQIQASLLPRHAPRIFGITLAARYEPMTEIAGDIYDFLKLDDYRQGVLIADVSGHGVPAALIASMVKGAFRAQADNIAHPDRVLHGMNQILAGQLGHKFVTAGCAFIDTQTGTLRYAGAGHPPLLILPGNSSECISLQENGLILGPFQDATYSSIERPLTPGDRLLFYTDGILEATNANGDEFGEDSLQDFMVRHRALPAESFAEALLTAIRKWTGLGQRHSLEDDLTLVVLDVQCIQPSEIS